MQLRGLGERCKLSSGVWAEPQPKSNLVHFSCKIWHLVATNLMIFLRINLPNFVQFKQLREIGATRFLFKARFFTTANINSLNADTYMVKKCRLKFDRPCAIIIILTCPLCECAGCPDKDKIQICCLQCLWKTKEVHKIRNTCTHILSVIHSKSQKLHRMLSAHGKL